MNESSIIGMIKALLGSQIIHRTFGDPSLLVRNDGFRYTMHQLALEGWSDLVRIDAADFDDQSELFLLAYHLNAGSREIRHLEVQVVISRASPWHSLADQFANAAGLEEPIQKAHRIMFVADERQVKAGANA